MYGDCAVNVSPSAGDLANIAIASADTAAAFGVRPPRVALLSYSTGASGSGAEVEKVRPAARPVCEAGTGQPCALLRCSLIVVADHALLQHDPCTHQSAEGWRWFNWLC